MIRKVVGLYYSPEGGAAKMTERLAHEIAMKLSENCPDEIAYECASIKDKDLPELGRETVVILGMPVYIGKAPMTAVRALSKIDGAAAMTLGLVAYSGRGYGNSLYELGYYATESGFELIGAGAIAISYGGRKKKSAVDRFIIDSDALTEYAEAASAKIMRLGGCDVEELRIKPAPLEVDGRLPIHRLSRVVPAAAAIAQGLLDGLPLGRKESEWFL